MIDIATVAVVALPSATIGAFLAHTFLPAKGEGSPNVCGDALTIERLHEELAEARKIAVKRYWMLEAEAQANAKLWAENRDLHIDIAEKAKRLSDAGLQSAGGCDHD